MDTPSRQNRGAQEDLGTLRAVDRARFIGNPAGRAGYRVDRRQGLVRQRLAEPRNPLTLQPHAPTAGAAVELELVGGALFQVNPTAGTQQVHAVHGSRRARTGHYALPDLAAAVSISAIEEDR